MKVIIKIINKANIFTKKAGLPSGTVGTIASSVLTTIGNLAKPNQMMNSLQKHPNRLKTVKELPEPGRGRYKGGISTYSNYINGQGQN